VIEILETYEPPSFSDAARKTLTNIVEEAEKEIDSK